MKIGGVVASAAIASSTSACSPMSSFAEEQYQNYFGLIASRRFDDAEKLLSLNVSMSLILFGRHELFIGKKNVTGELSNLMHSFGFSMIGDTATNAPGGMYWVQEGPWMKSDMLRGNNVEFNYGDCGGDILETTVINVLIRNDNYGDGESGLIKDIVLLDNQKLAIQSYPQTASDGIF